MSDGGMDIAHIRRVAIAIGGALVLMIVAGFFLSRAEQRATSATGDAAVPVDMAEVSAEDLRAAWAANEARAERDYGDRWFLVTGAVTSVTVNFSNDPVVHLRTDDAAAPVTIHLAGLLELLFFNGLALSNRHFLPTETCHALPCVVQPFGCSYARPRDPRARPFHLHAGRRL